MKKPAGKTSPWLWALSSGLLAALAVGCPKKNTTNTGGSTGTGPTPPPKVDPFEKCYGYDWIGARDLPADVKAVCTTAGIYEPLAECGKQDWTKPEAIDPARREFCEKVGYKVRVESCRGYNWARADLINPDDRAFCKGIGFQETIDPEICEKQDWTTPGAIPASIKEQCLKISFVPRCDPAKDPACVPPTDPNHKELFSHSAHGVDLPNEPRKVDMKFGGKPITCADCHSGECADVKKKGKGARSVDINRPGHNSCSGTRTGGCHSDFMTNIKVCKSCHSGPPKPGKPALRPYGSEVVLGNQQFGFDFNHSSHLGEASVTKQRGKEASCESCHALDKGGKDKKKDPPGVKMTTAGHAECGNCHCDADAAVKMNDCTTCHTGSEEARSGHSYLQWRPHAQAFKHVSHQKGPDGKDVACETCHVGVSEAEALGEIAVPPMLGCLQGCHDGTHTKDKKPAFDGWVQCAECHAPGELPKSQTKKDKKKK